MSFNSPAKLQRIERHLIRQRGAGVRTIAASFGFSIGTSSSSVALSSDVAASQEQPPAKRRKTIVELSPAKSTANDVRATITKTPKSTKARKRLQVEEDESRIIDVDSKKRKATVELPPKALDWDDVQAITNVKTAKTVKVRRRLRIEEDEGTGSAVGDDSFVFGQRKAKKKPATEGREAEAQHEIVTKKDEVTEVAPKGRPKRRAAAAAAAKVVEGFVEEARPVDKRRRDASPQKMARATKTEGTRTTKTTGQKAPEVQPYLEVRDVRASLLNVDEVPSAVPAVAKSKGRKRDLSTTAVKEEMEGTEQLDATHSLQQNLLSLYPRMAAKPVSKKSGAVKPKMDMEQVQDISSTKARVSEPVSALEKTSRKRKAESESTGNERTGKRSKTPVRRRGQVQQEANAVPLIPARSEASLLRSASGYNAVLRSQGESQAVCPEKRSNLRSRKTAPQQTLPDRGAADDSGQLSSVETAIAGRAEPAEPPPSFSTDGKRPTRLQSPKMRLHRRRALVETDANATMRSSSPEKPVSSSRLVSHPGILDDNDPPVKKSPRRRADLDVIQLSRSPEDVPHSPPRRRNADVHRLANVPSPKRKVSTTKTMLRRRSPRSKISKKQCNEVHHSATPIRQVGFHDPDLSTFSAADSHSPTGPSGLLPDATSRPASAAHHHPSMTRIAVPACRVSQRDDGAGLSSESMNSGAETGAVKPENAATAVAETLAPDIGIKPRGPKRERGPVVAALSFEGGGGREIERSSKVWGERDVAVRGGHEDVDWLFEVADATRTVKQKTSTGVQRAKVQPVEVAVNQRTSKSRTKMTEEIDLDDLISSIASFAENAAGAAKVSSDSSRPYRKR